MILRDQCILGIEGSGHSISVGLMKRGIPIGELFDNSGFPASRTLLHYIDTLLYQCRTKKEELQGICLTLGPGSFTSMRVSLSVAEAIGLGLHIPLYGIDELTLTANTLPFYPFPIKVVKNAYKGEIYTASFETADGTAKRLDELNLVTPRRFLQDLRDNELVLGNGLDRVLAENSASVNRRMRWNASFSRQVGGIDVIEYFLDSGAREPSDIPLEPIYVRLSEAELNYRARFGPFA